MADENVAEKDEYNTQQNKPNREVVYSEPALRMTPTVDEQGHHRNVLKQDFVGSDVVVDEQGNETPFTKHVTKGVIFNSDAGDAGATFEDVEYVFDVGMGVQSDKVTFADKDKKAALLEQVQNAKNVGELSVAMQAITDSYNSKTDNIGKSGYEEAQRLAAAKKLSFETGASDEVQAGNATNAEGNAYDVRDADSKGDGRTADIVDGNSESVVETGNVRDDNAQPGAQRGNNGDKEEGDGTGLGNGVGDGSGYGNAKGNGVDRVAGGGYNKDNSPIQTQAIAPTTSDTAEKNAIASYLTQIGDDTPINHIFNNDFYRAEPIAHWSYSVDFIPAMQLTTDNDNLLSMGQTLTKAVLTVKVPDRVVKSTVSHYKGMTIELPARAKTAGSLMMTFAETDSFPISKILDNLYQYARSNTYFENIDADLAAAKVSSEEDLQRYTQILRAYRRPLPEGGHIYNILVKMYRMKDARALDDVDSTAYPTFVYYFKGCDLKTVKSIEWDYDNDKPIDISCEWIYQFFEELSYTEYLQRYGSEANEEESTEKDNLEQQYEQQTEQESEEDVGEFNAADELAKAQQTALSTLDSLFSSDNPNNQTSFTEEPATTPLNTTPTYNSNPRTSYEASHYGRRR